MKRLFRRLLRHYFAGLAMQSILTAQKPTHTCGPNGETVGQYVSRKAYAMADCMLEATEK